MVYGLGNDLIEIKRVKKACEKEAFLLRYFTEEEILYTKKNSRMLAGNFAVKEAVSKSFGTGFLGFMPKDVEVLRDERGKPFVNLYGKAKNMMEEQGITRIEVTISNTQEYAMATAIALKE